MLPYNRGMPRALLAGLLLVLFALAAPLAVRADDEPAPTAPAPAFREEVLLARVVSDPRGEATRLARAAAAALEAGDEEQAYLRLVDLAEKHGDVLLPLRLFGAVRFGRTDGALCWPCGRAANAALARMPEAFRVRAAERWAAPIAALAAAVARGDLAALEVLATSYGATPEGAEALLMLARLDREGGRLVRASRRMESWLEVQPSAPAATRARVAVRLADVLSALDDAGALARLAVEAQDVREVPVVAAGRLTSLAERLAGWRRRASVARAAAASSDEASASPPAAADLFGLQRPVLLWSRSLHDPHHLWQGAPPRGQGVTAGAWGRGDTLVVHEGRRVRRFDLATGLERWHFPLREPVTMHAPAERYQDYDLPWRSVTPAGDAVLVVLGDPAASGRYLFQEQESDAAALGQECRLRLACLDLATGALRWHTGALDDEDPVLGDRATGCCSPPLVVGDAVYELFARRHGATTFHLACLDLKTGKARWVAALAAGESGRGDDQGSGINRFTSSFAQSAPFGARPTLAGGEICAVPNAGFAAGVAAADGHVRWVRALPRYGLGVTVHASEGQNIRGVPLAWGDAWILAPMDSPRLLCLARGTGDLRWQRGEPTPDDAPAWRDVLGIVREGAGPPRLRLSGWRPERMDPARGELVAAPEGDDPDAEWDVDGDDPGGAALDLGPVVVRLAAGALQARRWDQPGAPGARADLDISEPGMPPAGDLLRVGRYLVAIGRERLAVLAPRDVLEGAAVPALDPAATVARLALRAHLEGDPALLASALAQVTDIADRDLRHAVRARIAEVAVALTRVLAEGDGPAGRLRSLADVVMRLPTSQRGRPLHALTERLLDLDADEGGAKGRALAARLLVQWIETADDTLVPLDGDDEERAVRDVRGRAILPRGGVLRGGGVRGDLLAAQLLRRVLDDAEVRSVLEAREVRQARRLEHALASGDETVLRAALRRAIGTRAADAARAVFMGRLAKAGRFADAAAFAADRRLDPPWLGGPTATDARLRRAALLQMQEAAWLGEAGSGERARALAADLERWAPGGLKDAAGRTQTTLREDLRRRFGWHPVRGRATTFDAWRGLPAPKDRDEMRSVEFLELRGPGADALDDLVVLVRGLTVELWSRTDPHRLAVLHGPDEGWFGGSLTSVDGWVPEGGILVTSLVAGEPADASGVRAGDWVHTWAGRPVRDLPGFMQLVAASEPGKTIPVGVWRGGRRTLAQFTSGRRPAAQGRLMAHAPLWVTADGRILLPSRTGLSWIDVAARRRTPLWSWTEPGVLRRCDVLAGRAYALITRSLRPDLVVAIDPLTGREMWRREVEGSITWMEAVGSALWVQTLLPGQGFVLDAYDGRPRALWRTLDRHRAEFRKTWAPDREADLACGRGYVVSEVSGGVLVLRFINTTTAGIEHSDAWEYESGPGVHTYANPLVAAGPYVSVLRQGRLRLIFPDPLGGPPRHQVDLRDQDVLSSETHYGALDRDLRVFIRGRDLYTLRVPMDGRRNVNVVVFDVDYEALRARDPTQSGVPTSVVRVRAKRTWMSGPSTPRRYVLNVRSGFDGLIVSAAQLGGEHRAETWWVPPQDDEARPDNVPVRLLERQMNDARRHAPVPIGRHLFVPTDRGALVYALSRYRDR